MNTLPKPVVFDIHIFVNAVVGEDSQWPYLAQVPPASQNAAADCLSIAFDASDFSLFCSPHILENTARVLKRFGWSQPNITSYIEAIIDLVETSGGRIIDPPRAAFDVADFEDNLIIDLALACEAWLIVSDDTDLTSISPWNNRLPILRPREFVRRIIMLRRQSQF